MLRVVHAEGNPAARGRMIGSELGDLIDRSLGFYRDYFRELGLRDLSRATAPYREAAERSLPAHVEMVSAMAAGAGVSEIELFAVNTCEELEEGAVPAERCSSFTAVGPGFTLLAHNEQWLAGDAGNVAVVIERPVEGAVIVSPTLAACLPAVGMNSHGGAQGIHSLTASDDRVGVPRVLVSRHALEASDRQDAIRRAGLPGRAGGYAHLLAFRGGDALAVETSATRLAVLDGPGPHTNHYIAPELAEIRDEPGAGSVARLDRLTELLEERPPSAPEEAMKILSDHESAPQAICKHPAPNDPEESTIVFSMVCELEAGRMWVAAGNPCEADFEEVELAL
jgi:isopenicillin-N N-acyltransferase-like protein